MRPLALLLPLTACGIGLDQYQYDDQGVVIDSAQPEAFGNLVLSRTSLNFGEVEPGQSTSESLTLLNDGDELINLLNVGLVNGDAFRITTTLVGDIEAGGEQVLTVEFTPSGAGSFTDALVLETDAPGAEYVEVSLSGSGTAGGGGDDDSGDATTPRVRVTPSTYNFGSVDLYDVGSLPFTIENAGQADLTIVNFVGSDSVFSWDRSFSLPYVLEPGETKAGNFTFTPTAEGRASGTVTVQTNDPSTPNLALSVSGEGVQGCSICAPVIKVLQDSAIVTSVSVDLFSSPGNASETFTIENQGDQNLIISDIHVENDLFVTSGTYSVSGFGTLPVVLTPWDSRQVTVTLNWTGVDGGIEVYTASPEQNYIRITSNDPITSEYTVTLSSLVL